MTKHLTSYMLDTSQEMLEYQHKMVMAMSPEDRFKMGLKMADDGQEMMLAGIKNTFPGLTDEEYRIKFLRKMILYDKSLQWLDELLPPHL